MPIQGQVHLVQYIAQKLAHLNGTEKIDALQKLMGEFKAEYSAKDLDEYEEQVTTRLFALILGRKVNRADLSSKELLHRLARSLNTIFDSLNTLIGSIDATFEGKTAGDQTIRRVIGGHLQDEDLTTPLENYLGKISREEYIGRYESALRAVRERMEAERKETLAKEAANSQ